MSTYVTFYLHHKDEFVPLGSFSRNSMMYTAATCYIDYGKCDLVTRETTRDMGTILKNNRITIENFKNKCRDQILFIERCNNAVVDKVEEYNALNREISDDDEAIEEIDYCLNFLFFLEEIMISLKYEINLAETAIYCAHECVPYIKNENESEE